MTGAWSADGLLPPLSILQQQAFGGQAMIQVFQTTPKCFFFLFHVLCLEVEWVLTISQALNKSWNQV